MKRRLLWITVLALTVGTVVQAQEYELIGLGTRIEVFADATFQSKYMWRGFDWFGNKAAWQFTAGASLPEFGLGALVSGHGGMGSGTYYRNGNGPISVVNRERWDYSVYYHNRVAAGETYEMKYRLGYVYYNHPKLPQIVDDMQEGHLFLSFPNILGYKGLIPSYALIKMLPARSGSYIDRAGYASGWLHVLNLDYIVSVPPLLPEYPDQLLKLHSEIIYNDGLNPVDGVPVKRGFSHAVFGGSTDFPLGYGASLTPSVFYQYSLEDTVNMDDEFWGTVGIRWQF